MNPPKMSVVTIGLVLMAHLPTFADTLYPNDDVTIRGSTNYNASDPFGLFVKNSGDVSYIEYTLGSLPVTEAKLVLHNDDTGVSNPWTIVVKGDEFSFDEATFNTTFAGSGWPQVGTIPNVMAVAFYEMDLTTWYNNNLGKTMSLFMTRDTQPSGSGPIFEDREGTKTGDALTYGPRLEVDPGGEEECPESDMDDDCAVEVRDLLIFLDLWLDADFPTQDLIAHWKMDGDPHDSAGDHNGTVYGNPIWDPNGYINGALNFDGEGDYVEVPVDEELNVEQITMAAWVKTDDPEPAQLMFVLNREMTYPGTYTLWLDNTNYKWGAQVRLDGDEANGVIVYSNNVATTDWTHIAATYDGVYLKLYIDGVTQADTEKVAGFIDPDNSDILTLGAHTYFLLNFTGSIDDVRIYDRALSADEIGILANEADHNKDGSVNLNDFIVIADEWLVGTAVNITQQPANLALDEGNTAAFSVTAEGAEPISYQWQKNTIDLSDGGDISGATTNELQIANTEASDEGQYRCVVSNKYNTVISDEATLTITVGEFKIVFPGAAWQSKTPTELGLDGAKLDQFANNVGGVGCIVRQGYVVKTWGSQSAKADWASAAKPVISTMLFFAIEEALLTDVHELIEDHGWDLNTKDEPMEFYHLANMTSGYARGEAPGAAWAYNDYAIKLYAKTLFDNVYQTTANIAATDPDRLSALQFEDGSIFSSREGYGVYTSVRDFARIGWLWCNYGYWNGTQVLPRKYFDDYMKAHVSSGLPRTTTGGSDYLVVGTYGGGSDQTADGPGVYGFNWWCNPNQSNWPDAPADTIQANGHWGKEVVTVIPSLSLVVAYRTVNARGHTTGSSSSDMNQDLKLLVEACPEFPLGQIMVDDANPDRMVYHASYENGREKPVCFAGPGDPEDFFYNDTANNINLLTGRGARCTYITAILQDFGGGNPGSGAALDAKLDEWEGYITQLENAGIITVFFFFDDSQPLTGNWQEIVDKCVAKFKHHKLLIWSVAEEYQEALSAAQVSQVAARIKQQDNYNHIVGVHQLGGNNFDFLADSNIDMFLMQLNYSTPDDLHNQVKNSNANGTKILNMAEASDHAKQTRQNVRLWNWASIMGGASAVQVLWMGRASDPADWNDPDKYDDCARLMDFMESTRLNETSNHDELARGNTDYVLANPGQVYIAYGDSGNSLGLNVQAGTYREKWFDPVDGDWVNQGNQVLAAGDKTFTKPGAIGVEAALYLQVE